MRITNSIIQICVT